jgi:hypothetical protein
MQKSKITPQGMRFLPEAALCTRSGASEIAVRHFGVGEAQGAQQFFRRCMEQPKGRFAANENYAFNADSRKIGCFPVIMDSDPSRSVFLMLSRKESDAYHFSLYYGQDGKYCLLVLPELVAANQGHMDDYFSSLMGKEARSVDGWSGELGKLFKKEAAAGSIVFQRNASTGHESRIVRGLVQDILESVLAELKDFSAKHGPGWLLRLQAGI